MNWRVQPVVRVHVGPGQVDAPGVSVGNRAAAERPTPSGLGWSMPLITPRLGAIP